MMRSYRVSALLFAALRMWRGWTVIVPVVLCNTLLQALLMWPPFTYHSQWWVVTSSIVSGAIFICAFALVASVALRVADGRVSWAIALRTLKPHFWRYAVWAVLLSCVVIVGLALHTVPGLVVLALTPFLLLSALDGASNPVSRNFRILGKRLGRWLVTTIVVGVGLLIGTLIAGFTVFFWRGAIGAALVWLVGGLLFAWVTVAWGLIYRSAWVKADA